MQRDQQCLDPMLTPAEYPALESSRAFTPVSLCRVRFECVPHARLIGAGKNVPVRFSEAFNNNTYAVGGVCVSHYAESGLTSQQIVNNSSGMGSMIPEVSWVSKIKQF